MRRIHNDNPNLEESQTQNAKIRRYLEEGRTVTSLESLYLFDCLNLRGRMDDLRKAGVAVDGVFIAVGKPRGKNKKQKHVKAYFIAEAFAKRHGTKVDDDLPDKVVPIAIAAARKNLWRFSRIFGRV